MNEKIIEIFRVGHVTYYLQILSNHNSPFVGLAYYILLGKTILLDLDVRCLN